MKPASRQHGTVAVLDLSTGELTATHPGQATLTVTSGTHSTSATVTVTATR